MVKTIKSYIYKIFIENWTLKIIAGVITAVVYLITRSH